MKLSCIEHAHIDVVLIPRTSKLNILEKELRTISDKRDAQVAYFENHYTQLKKSTEDALKKIEICDIEHNEKVRAFFDMMKSLRMDDQSGLSINHAFRQGQGSHPRQHFLHGRRAGCQCSPLTQGQEAAQIINLNFINLFLSWTFCK